MFALGFGAVIKLPQCRSMEIGDEVSEANLRDESQNLTARKEAGGRKVNFCLPCLLRERRGRNHARLAGRQRLINRLQLPRTALKRHLLRIPRDFFINKISSQCIALLTVPA